MKIVMLCDAFFEGLHYQENQLTKYYLKNGHNVVIIGGVWADINQYYVNNYDKTLPESIEQVGNLKIIKLHYQFNFLNKVRFFKNLSNIFDEELPDLIYVHDIHFNLHNAVKYKKKKNDCRLIMDFHADSSNSGNNWLSRNVLHRIVRKIYLNAHIEFIDKIFPVVPASAKFLSEMYGVKLERMELLPLGVDTDLVAKLRLGNVRQKVRNKLEISEDDIIVVTAGKLSPLKKTEQLIKAFRKISNKNVALLVIGGCDQSKLKYLESLKELMLQDDRVRYLGWMNGDDVVMYLLASDIAVFPASQSVLWQESIGAGLAVVLGKYSNTPNGIKEQDVNYLNREGNLIVLNEKEDKVEEIRKTLINLIENKDLLKKMKIGAEKVKEEFLSYDIIVNQTLNS